MGFKFDTQTTLLRFSAGLVLRHLDGGVSSWLQLLLSQGFYAGFEIETAAIRPMLH